MKIPISIKIKQVAMSDLMLCHKSEEVLAYCQQCDNYNKNHSCPDFIFDTDQYLAQYKYLALIMTTVYKDDFESHLEIMKAKNYSSQLMNRYMAMKPEQEYSWEEQLSLYIFNCVKDDMAKALIGIEESQGECISIPPGSCTKCSVCLKELGQACCHPEQLRYSLEALGFLVSDIYETYFDKKLEWVSHDLPNSFDTCSAILSHKSLNEALILKYLEGISLSL